jgi:hypothetical protein
MRSHGCRPSTWPMLRASLASPLSAEAWSCRSSHCSFLGDSEVRLFRPFEARGSRRWRDPGWGGRPEPGGRDRRLEAAVRADSDLGMIGLVGATGRGAPAARGRLDLPLSEPGGFFLPPEGCSPRWRRPAGGLLSPRPERSPPRPLREVSRTERRGSFRLVRRDLMSADCRWLRLERQWARSPCGESR